LFLSVLQALVIALGAPLLAGTLRTLKARLVGRRGPAPWQPFLDLRKLFGKTPVVSETTSWIFRATPYVLVGAMLVAALAAPVLTSRPPLAFAGILLLMSLFLLGTFFLALAGLDAGSAFGGMGSSRAVTVAGLAEPTVMLAVFALALRASTTNLGGIVERVTIEPLLAVNPAGLLALAGKLALLAIALAALETAIAKLRLFRVPELLAGSFALAVLSVSAVFLLR